MGAKGDTKRKANAAQDVHEALVRMHAHSVGTNRSAQIHEEICVDLLMRWAIYAKLALARSAGPDEVWRREWDSNPR